MLGAETHPENARGDAPQEREMAHKLQCKWQVLVLGGLRNGTNQNIVLNEDLDGLGHFGGPFPALLNRLKLGK